MKLMPLYAGNNMTLNEAGFALADSFKKMLYEKIGDLVEAGYDPIHIESLLIKEVTFAVVFNKLQKYD